jgi:predicted DNA-binding protein (MmcQ/YjbR family)
MAKAGKEDVAAALREVALAYPGTREEFPWGERVIKVGKKVFVFLGHPEGGGLGLSVKLPVTGAVALSLPFAEPTGYGLGKAGWVSARFGPREKPPVGLLKAWIEESYRAIAPKRLQKQIGAKQGTSEAAKQGSGSEAAKQGSASKAAKRQTARRRGR